VPADEVGVQVRLDDVPDAEAGARGLLDVLLDIALRVNDRRLALGADEVRGVRQASEVELFEVHRGTQPPAGFDAQDGVESGTRGGGAPGRRPARRHSIPNRGGRRISFPAGD
jgi:hypothetical protein